jgi:hypothetical protein
VPHPELAACYCTANEEPVRIQYVNVWFRFPIDIFPEMKLCGLVISKTHCTENSICVFPELKLRVLVPNSKIHVSMGDLYIPMVGLLILLQPNR